MSTYARNGMTAATSRSLHFVIINYHPNMVHPERISSPRFAFDRDCLSVCILCFIAYFTIVPCTALVFNYHLERLKVFGEVYIVRQVVPIFMSIDFQTFASKGNLVLQWYVQIQCIFSSNKSTSFS